MDKVKHFLGLAGKHHFWILCAIIALITVGSWYTTSAKLRADYKAQATKITGAETELNGIIGIANHPNNEYKTRMDELTNTYKQQLRRLWAQQYEDQGVNLQWPQEVIKDNVVVEPGLTEEFVYSVKDMRPIETEAYDKTTNKPKEIKPGLREQYRDFVKIVELPRLAEIIGAVWHPAEMMSGSVRNPNAVDETDAAIVEWHAENQEYLQNTRFDWSKEPDKRPSTLQILYAQEDLWVLETLINIIGKTNQDADARHNAVVKEIKYLKIGADAVGLSGQVTPLVAATAAGPGQPGAQPTTGPIAPAPLAPQPIPVPGANMVVAKDPAEGRYVDMNYQPVPPTRLRAAFTSKDPNEASLAVAKRMPIRMHLVVDQRYVNRLLAECGNSNLIVEIRQVRVNRELYEGGPKAGSPSGYPVPGGERGFQPAYDPGRQTGPRSGPVPRGEPSRGRMGPGGGDAGEEEKSRHEIEMELYGIVYIYNPVNEAMVTVVGDGATPAPTTTVAPTTTTTPPAETAPMPMATTPMPATPMTTAPMTTTPMPATPMPAPATTTPMPATTTPAAPMNNNTATPAATP